MSRTIRKQNPKAVRNAFTWDERKHYMVQKGVKAFRQDRCSHATVDSAGNAKLDNRSTTTCKVGAQANRIMRRAHRIAIARQLEDA